MSADRLVFRNRLGRTLKMVRQARGLSQPALASKMSTSRSVISKFERGETLPNVVTLEHACNSLSVPCSVVLHLAESEDKAA